MRLYSNLYIQIIVNLPKLLDDINSKKTLA